MRYLLNGTDRAWGFLTLFCGLLLVVALILGHVASDSPASAAGIGGPVILGGDDLTDHGSRNPGTNVNVNGWLYIQKALENIGPQVTRAGHDGSVAVLGSADSTATSSNAGAAYHYAVPDAGAATPKLSGVASFHNGPTAINTFFANLAAGVVNPAIIVTVGTGTSNDLDGAEGVALSNNANAIAGFVNSGGGLLSHGFGATAYGWLSALIPGATSSPSCDYFSLTLTAAGQAAFPTLTNANITAGPCHNHFTNHGLTVLASDLGGPGGAAQDIIIGGSKVILPGNLTLTPATAANLVGQTHTVTAFAEDGDPLMPAPGVLVTFQVTAGPNAGEASDPGECTTNANCTTDASGNVSWAYTSSGGGGIDTIVASFVDGSGQVQSDSAQKTWNAAPTPTPPPTTAPTPKLTPTPQPDCPGCPPEMALNVKGGDCDDALRPTKCNVVYGTPFHLSVNAIGIPASGYVAMQTFIDYGNALVYKPEALEIEMVWPDAGVVRVTSTNLGPGTVYHGALSGITSLPVSTYVGKLVAVSMNCPDASTNTVVELLPYGDPLALTNGSAFMQSSPKTLIVPKLGSLTINCVGLEPPTPTVVPAQGDIFPVAGGSVGDTIPAISAAFSSPADVAVVEPVSPQIDVYIADAGHCRVRVIVPGGTTSTVAGTGECGYGGDGAPAVDAMLDNPTGVDVDASGNIYVADEGNCRVRKVDNSTGIITTVAGNGTCGNGGDGGSATAAQLDGPYDVLVDGSDLLISDRGNCRVRKVNSGTGVITTIAGGGTCGYGGDGGLATAATLNDPRRLALDAGGNLHIADGVGVDCRVRKVDNGTGIITTVAGGGTCGYGGDGGLATAATLDEPDGLAFDNAGNLFIAGGVGVDCRVRKVDSGTGIITTVAGGGTCGYGGDGGDATSAQLSAPSGLSVDSSQRLYIADRDNHRIRRVGSPITTIAGTGLPDFCGDTFVAIDESCLDSPYDVVVDDAGNVYIADAGNHRIRVINAGTGSISTLAGKNDQTNCSSNMALSGASALTLCLELPRHIAVSPGNGLLYISDEGRNQIWLVNVGSGAFSRVAGAANGAAGLCADNTTSLAACLDQPRGLALQQVSGTDQYLFVAEGGNSGRVLRVNLLNNTVRTVFQDTGNELSSDVALGPGDSLYIAQPAANRVRWVDTGADSEVDGTDDPPVTVAGSGTAGLTTDETVATLAKLDNPVAIAMSRESELLISDRNNHRLWVVRTGDTTPNLVDGEPSERIYRIVGNGTLPPSFCGDPKPKPDPTPANVHNARDACLSSPADLSYDGYFNPPVSRSVLYFADELNQRVRKVASDCDDDGLTDAVELAGVTSTEPGLGPFETLECTADTDGDGCSDAEEIGSNEGGGGRRNPENKWDFYDVSGLTPGQPDGVIDLLFDILGVIQHYAPSGAAPYDAHYDRGPTSGPNAWNMTAADGVIDLLNDILGVIRQFSHDCR